ncbi:MAG: SDR family oxidoreductase [Phototrophicaceae bacterium]|jgi:NAD(P)-dependent dehydrogenase (short-subunit alcohol dehydrogenase family)
MNNLFELNDKIAIVTGGSGVLGKAICLALAQAGATVVLMARDADKLALAVEEVRSAGGTALGIAADVLDKDSLLAAAEQIRQRYGRLDILVNAAGGNRAEATAIAPQRPFFDLPQDALQWVVDLNLMGTLLPSQVFGAVMAQQQAGVIINISSMAAFRPLTRVVAYAGAKAAVNNFTQWLAVMMAMDYSPNIRVNAVAPGFFVGEQNYFLLYDEHHALTPRGQQIISHTPMGRFGDPQDLCGAILWLASDASRFVTGIIVPVDGGFSAFSGV